MGLNDKINTRIAEALLEVEKHTAALAVGLAQWQNGNRLTGARPLSASAHPRVWGGAGRLVGWSVVASDGPVQLLLRDSRVAGDGDVLAALSLVDGEADHQWMGPGGVSFGEGLYLELSGAGTLLGAVWIGAVD